jgi:hypothetical protein
MLRHLLKFFAVVAGVLRDLLKFFAVVAAVLFILWLIVWTAQNHPITITCHDAFGILVCILLVREVQHWSGERRRQEVEEWRSREQAAIERARIEQEREKLIERVTPYFEFIKRHGLMGQFLKEDAESKR